jgi:hypothetical protein
MAETDNPILASTSGPDSIAATVIDLQHLFAEAAQGLAHAHRRSIESQDGSAQFSRLIDSFDDAECVSLRSPAGGLTLAVDGGYGLQAAAAGGWLLSPRAGAGPHFWIPRLPAIRKLDTDGHVLTEGHATIEGIAAGAQRLSLSIAGTVGDIDLIAWRVTDPSLVAELGQLSALEQGAWYQWGSHTTFERPADLYKHLIHGHIYENRTQWPFNWKICSENDAHSLYVTLSGLFRSTGKRIYDLLRKQVVLSVVDRLGADGAFRHGEWSRNMECHYRLHASGIHLMLDYLAEHDDPTVADALQRAARFLAARPDRTDLGQWFLHDELEQSEAGMRQSPFTWKASRVLGKSPTNMLVLNTHLDTLIGLDRYRRERGDATLDELLDSAHGAAMRVLALRPAEALYRLVAKLLYLTFLPPDKAARLPFLQRALKRVGWKWLTPRLHHLKTAFPRLVFPGGFIDRAVSLKGVSDAYQPINLMDLLRFARRFPSPAADAVVHEALAFTQGSGLVERWAGMKNKSYAIGFWAEALWHACMLYPNPDYRSWLGVCMLRLERMKMGLPPSLLGANAEAVPPSQQVACPIVNDARLRVANLSHGNTREFIVANASKDPVALTWVSPPDRPIEWTTADGLPADAGAVPAASWLIGRSR